MQEIFCFFRFETSKSALDFVPNAPNCKVQYSIGAVAAGAAGAATGAAVLGCSTAGAGSATTGLGSGAATFAEYLLKECMSLSNDLDRMLYRLQMI